MKKSARNQQGFFLIEALVAILIFSLGIVAMIGTGTVSVTAQSDAKYRTEAARLAADITQEIYVNINTATPSTLPVDLAKFERRTTGDDCTFTGSDPTDTVVAKPVVDRWVARVQATLPGSTAEMQQIRMVTTSGINEIVVRICWQAPSDTQPRRHEYTAFLN